MTADLTAKGLDEWTHCASSMEREKQATAVLWGRQKILWLLLTQPAIVKKWFGPGNERAFCGVLEDPYLKYLLVTDYAATHWVDFLERFNKFLLLTKRRLNVDSIVDIVNDGVDHIFYKAFCNTSSPCEIMDTQREVTRPDMSYGSFEPLNKIFSEQCTSCIQNWLKRPTQEDAGGWVERILWLYNKNDVHRTESLFALFAFSRERKEVRIIDHRIFVDNMHLSQNLDVCLPAFTGTFNESYQYLLENGVVMENKLELRVLLEEEITIEAYWNRAGMKQSWFIMHHATSYGMANRITSWAQKNYRGRCVSNTAVKMFLVSRGYRTRLAEGSDRNIVANIEWKLME